MKNISIAITLFGVFVAACSAPVEESADDSTGTSEAIRTGTHFNFAASPLMNPSGPAYFTQMHPIGSEVADIECPGPTYTPTDRVLDPKGALFTGPAGACDGTYTKAPNGRIVVHCSTPIEKHSCTSGTPVTQ